MTWQYTVWLFLLNRNNMIWSEGRCLRSRAKRRLCDEKYDGSIGRPGSSSSRRSGQYFHSTSLQHGEQWALETKTNSIQKYRLGVTTDQGEDIFWRGIWKEGNENNIHHMGPASSLYGLIGITSRTRTGSITSLHRVQLPTPMTPSKKCSLFNLTPPSSP